MLLLDGDSLTPRCTSHAPLGRLFNHQQSIKCVSHAPLADNSLTLRHTSHAPLDRQFNQQQFPKCACHGPLGQRFTSPSTRSAKKCRSKRTGPSGQTHIAIPSIKELWDALQITQEGTREVKCLRLNAYMNMSCLESFLMNQLLICKRYELKIQGNGYYGVKGLELNTISYTLWKTPRTWNRGRPLNAA
ncbi:hypothetical protein Lal_00042672 [Lupinus albus]|nr:hypothetical protein Lal_00042672 [Lupinus albus]